MNVLGNLLSKFKKNNSATITEIEELALLMQVEEQLQNYKNVVCHLQIEEFLSSDLSNEKATSTNEALNYLSDLFNSINNVIRSSTLDAQSINEWKRVLRELLVGIPYRGEYLEIAHQLKDGLDGGHTLVESTNKTKKLIFDYSASLCEDQEEIHEYLVDTASKLQLIYSEISETQDEYFSRTSSKNKIESTFKEGIRHLSSSFAQHEDIDSLKKSMNKIVNAIQTKVIEEIESEENETKMLEKKIAGMSDKIKSLENHTEDLEKAIHKKHVEAITDPLTGLLNRAAYVQALEKAWINWKNDKAPATMLVWDIDHFKMINDRQGHAAGDKVLQSVASKLKTGIHGDDILARFGGEEFVMLLIGKSIEEGKQLAEEIRHLIATTDFTYKKTPLYVTISCGVATFIENDTPTTLFERADKALYRAKRNGRDRVEVLKVA